MHQQQTAFENIVGKGEIVHYELFLLLPQCFLLNQLIVSPFVHIFNIIPLFAAEFEKPKIGISGKGLSSKLDLCGGKIQWTKDDSPPIPIAARTIIVSDHEKKYLVFWTSPHLTLIY